MSHFECSILAFFTNFGPFKGTCMVALFHRKLQVLKNSSKFFCLFNSLLSTKNVNVARFARIVE